MTLLNEPRAPYALEPTAFPFPALAALAGRAPLGGPREVALGCFVVARIVSRAAVDGLSAEQRRERVQGVKHWLGAAALAVPVKQVLMRAADASVADEREGLKSALDSVMTVTANQLDPAARLELGRLAQAVAK